MKKSIIFVFLFSASLSAGTIQVTTSADSGAGSFRQAVSDSSDGGTITFNITDGSFEIDFATLLDFNKSLNIYPYNNGKNIVFSGTTATLNIDASKSFAMTGSDQAIWEIDMALIAPSTSYITMSNSGTLILNANNTAFLGHINMSKGIIEVGNGLGAVDSTEIIDMTTTTNTTALSLQDQGTINMVLHLGTTSHDISVATGTGTIAGAISATSTSGVINKKGEGILVLSGVNTALTGLTTVTEGTLTLNSGLPGAVTVESGATVNGSSSIGGAVIANGTVNALASIAGAVTVNSGGVISGIDSISNNVTVNSGGSVDTINTITGHVSVEGTGSAIGSIDGIATVIGGSLEVVTAVTGSVYVEQQGTMSGNGSSTITGTLFELLDQSTISGFNSMTFTGAMTVTDSEMQGDGTSTISAASLAMTSSSVVDGFNSIALTGALTVAASEMHGDGISTIDAASLAMTSESVIDGFSSITLTGALTVNDSTIIGNQASSITAAVTVSNDGDINGFGLITGNVTVNGGAIAEIGSISGLLSVLGGGLFSPGDPFGTTTVGSLNLAVDSITNIELNETNSSLIDVSGAATIAGTVNILQHDGLYFRSASYEIVKVAGVLTGVFGQITQDSFGFEYFLNQIGNSIYLNYTTDFIATQGLTGNVLTFANYLNQIPLVFNEYLVLAGLSGETLFDALNSASPARNAFPTFVSQQTMFSFSHMLNDYLREKRFLRSLNGSLKLAEVLLPYEYELMSSNSYYYPLQKATKDKEAKHALWITGFVDFAHQNSESQNTPFNFISKGVLLGFDVQGADKDIAGIAAGYAYSQVSDYNNKDGLVDEYNNMGNSNIAYYIASLYANYVIENFYFEGALWGVFHQIENWRNIFYSDINVVAKSSINGWQMAPHLEMGYVFDGAGFDFEPYVGVDYVVNWEGGAQEIGAGYLNMRQESNIASMIQAEGGLRFYQSFKSENGIFGFKEGFSYINRTPFNTGRVTSAIFGSSEFFTLTSFQSSQNLAAVSLVYFAEAGTNRDVIFSLGYQGQFGDQYMLNEVALSISKSF